MSTIQVVIADDQEAVRAGLLTWFEDTEIEVVASCKQASALIPTVLREKPRVLISETKLGGDDLWPSIEELKTRLPATAILIFTSQENPVVVARAKKTPVAGYVSKTAPRDEFLWATREVADGRSFWWGEIIRRPHVRSAAVFPSEDLQAPLTPRERDVLRHLSRGLTNKQIGEELKISHETVKEHVQRILQKIGVRDRTQAALWVVRSGIFD